MTSAPQAPIDPDIDALVRRVDVDRWLASRFAPAPARARLIALYAVNYDIARTAEVVREPALGDIRLEWWRGALAGILQGEAAGAQPALNALIAAWGADPALAGLQEIIAARARDLDPAPFEHWGALERYVDATSGALVRLALRACGTEAPALAEAAGRAWAYVGLARSARRVIPGGGDRAQLLARAEDAHNTARKLARAAPASAFPAFGYLAQAPAYLRALRSGRPAPALLSRQLRMVGAAASGRI